MRGLTYFLCLCTMYLPCLGLLALAALCLRSDWELSFWILVVLSVAAIPNVHLNVPGSSDGGERISEFAGCKEQKRDSSRGN